MGIARVDVQEKAFAAGIIILKIEAATLIIVLSAGYANGYLPLFMDEG